MIKLVVEAKEPVYAELGGQPTGYQVSFGPDRDADNSEWTPQGARPAASASLIVSPEAAEAYTVGSAVYLGNEATYDAQNRGGGSALSNESDEEFAARRGAPAGEPVHPDTTDAEQKAQAATPDGEPVPFTDDGKIDGGAITETGTDDAPRGKRAKA